MRRRSRNQVALRGASWVAAMAVMAVAIGACGDPSPSEDPRGVGPLQGGVLPAVREGVIEVSGAVVAQPVLGERAALYFTVSNAGPAPDTILEVDAGELGFASLHRSDTEGGIMRMRPAGPVEIPARGRVELRPGGLHVMIEELTDTLTEGDTVVVTVRTARVGPMSVEAMVVAYTDLLDYLEAGVEEFRRGPRVTLERSGGSDRRGPGRTYHRNRTPRAAAEAP